MRMIVIPFLGLAAPALTVAAQPRDVTPQGDAFDQLSSPFVIRDWISFARDEHERLEGVQAVINPRFSPILMNTHLIASGKSTFFEPIPLWDIVASFVGAETTQFVTDPIHSCTTGKALKLELHGMLKFEYSALLTPSGPPGTPGTPGPPGTPNPNTPGIPRFPGIPVSDQLQ